MTAMLTSTAQSLWRCRILLPITALLMIGCSTAPYRPAVDSTTPRPSTSMPDPGGDIARLASQLVGSPYRFGGSGPDAFDCSGLVFFVHSRLGISVPRTAAEQSVAASPVDATELAPGDLVFFSESGPEITHVGIYAGKGTFVHAPNSGRAVTYGSLLSDYYLQNFAGAGRFYPQR